MGIWGPRKWKLFYSCQCYKSGGKADPNCHHILFDTKAINAKHSDMFKNT